MQKIEAMARRVSATDATILLTGESGTGKELVARALHNLSPRAAHPFVPVNCAALPEDLLESELFGHVRGAFTGALSSRVGMFQLAHGGTILLDEVGEMPLSLQAKLLRVLQNHEVRPVGSDQSLSVNIRVIASTNKDLQREVEKSTFREDLFYRLNVVAIKLPPLRSRPDDIPLLAFHFLQKYAARTGRDIRKISPEAMRLLQSQPWPGNVRELENAIEHSVVFCRKDTILPGDLPFGKKANEVLSEDEPGPAPSQGFGLPGGLSDLPYRDAKQRAVAAFELAYFEQILKRTQGNVSEAARQAGLDRSNFRRAARRAGATSRD